MKKSFLGVSMLFALLILLCACAPTQDNMSNKPLNEYLISNSIDMTCVMDSMAQSAEYIEFASGAPELARSVTEIGADDYTSPSRAVLITVPDETADIVIKNTAGELGLSDDAYEMVVTKMLSAVPLRINAHQGAMAIAATSLLTANKVFQQHNDLTANAYVVLIYDNYSSVTMFRNSADGITSASSTFLFLNDEFENAVTDETVFEYFSEMFNVSEFEVEYVTGDTIASYQ